MQPSRGLEVHHEGVTDVLDSLLDLLLEVLLLYASCIASLMHASRGQGRGCTMQVGPTE